MANRANRHVVEAILDDKVEDGDVYYLIKWSGYSNRRNSWVISDDLDADFLLPQYLQNKYNKLLEDFVDQDEINEKEEFFEKSIETINEVKGKIEEIENRLADKTKGKDLRGVKQLINKNVQTGQEIQLLEDRLNEISKKVNKMNEKKHFAVPELIEKVEELVVRFNSLHEPLERMRAELNESMSWHQLAFDVDVELQWIGGKKLIVECPQLGHSLTEVQQLVKRHEQLISELDCHQPLVTELLNKGRKLANADGINKHSCHQEIDAKCLELSNSWKNLMEISINCRNLLNKAHSREQLLFELSEAENWLSEKNKQIETREGAISEGHGGAQTLLAWLKTLQNELGPFHLSLVELKNKCINLKDIGIFEEEIAERESKIEEQAKNLEERARLSAEHANARVNLHNEDKEKENLPPQIKKRKIRNNASLYLTRNN
uniref:Chromo domain-containing protein n=1 Tax=Meloidogyne enterolobii TaxID=390850 RepID=A0A6V7U4H0_MELEN|nr:unnamed protein product [Meloidogyne enterolobii]